MERRRTYQRVQRDHKHRRPALHRPDSLLRRAQALASAARSRAGGGDGEVGRLGDGDDLAHRLRGNYDRLAGRRRRGTAPARAAGGAGNESQRRANHETG